ncbi:MAG: hypothetical protein ABIQ31_12105 [Ferruginibacter sp.]
MKYYLVDYIILDKKTVIENHHAGIFLHTFANIEDFKKGIAELKNNGTDPESVVIKSYKQISEEAYNSLKTTTV